MNLSEQIDRDLTENADVVKTSSDWFKFKEGKNVMRVITQPVALFEDYDLGICYTDCGFTGSPKYLCHILDRAEGSKPKLWKMNLTVMRMLADMQASGRFAFDGFPMPYDIEINAKNAGTKEVVYTLLPGMESPAQVPDKLTPCEEVIEKLKAKNKEKHEADGTRARILKERAEVAAFLESKKAKPGQTVERVDMPNYPKDEDAINPEDIPF